MWRGVGHVTLILVSTLSRVKRVFMSIRACLVSLYTVPRKLSGRESWKRRPFTITRSPMVIVPTQQTQNNLERCKSSSTIVSCIYLWIQDLKKCHSNHFFFQAVKADKACYSLNPSPPSVISFSASRLLYFLFTPFFSCLLCFVLIYFLLSSSVRVLLVVFICPFDFVLQCFFFKLSYF